ncbi:MAG TPA: hypothetical protein VIG76_00505 [Amnibacterium sp.]|jgi:Na+/phosphate symporter|uniref:hypothetical protein n=1 Tax=Amnibacterium sp. TaxID=1872496 RepID=UPI002F937658
MTDASLTDRPETPGIYLVEGRHLTWDGERWLDRFGEEVRASAEWVYAVPAADNRPRPPYWPLVVGLVALVLLAFLVVLPPATNDSGTSEAMKAMFAQYGFAAFCAIVGPVFIAAWVVIVTLLRKPESDSAA